MATVRIYKVAELLNTSSQEVLALLKRAHGIELKSASSTIEEVVARQFVERLARERNITLPGGDMFAEGPAAKPGAKKPGLSAKKPEPAAEAAAVDQDAAPSFSIAGVGDKTLKKLISAGFDTAEKIALASVDALSEVQGIGAKTAERILAAARGESPAAEPAAEEEKL